MKKLLPLLVLAPLVGCSTDKSSDSQVMAPVNNPVHDAPSTGGASQIPANVQSSIPGGGKPAGN